MRTNKIAIIGTVGVPASYGGFETLAENMIVYHKTASLADGVTVYCSSKNYPDRPETFLSARLKYIPLHANGVQSIPYDMFSLLSAVWNRNDVILLLGVSGAVLLPVIRLLSSARILTNIDGIEWRRQKWRGLAKWFLRCSERIAIRFSHEVIADNGAIVEYIQQAYGVSSRIIAYGGDHAVNVDAVPLPEYGLPEQYAFSICRIEPENNVHIIIEAFSRQDKLPLVMVGNWDNSEYGRRVRERYSGYRHLFLLDPVYDLGKLKTLRSGAAWYIHGHSAGGTNPSLVEAMHFGRPILAFNCSFNQSTTENRALFFKNEDDLLRLITVVGNEEQQRVGHDMLQIARRRYTWDIVARQYFSLMADNNKVP